MDERAAYLGELRAKLAQWDERHARLREQMHESAHPDAEFERRMEIVEMQRRAIEQQIEDLEQRPQSGWEDFKEGVERAWGELGQALNDTIGKYGR